MLCVYMRPCYASHLVFCVLWQVFLLFVVLPSIVVCLHFFLLQVHEQVEDQKQRGIHVAVLNQATVSFECHNVSPHNSSLHEWHVHIYNAPISKLCLESIPLLA